MTSVNEWIPRLQCRITEDQYRALEKHIPRGLKSMIFGVIIDGLIERMEKDGGNRVIAEVLSGRLTVEQIMEGEEVSV